MCDAVGSNTQRHEVGNVTHGFVGHPVCECAPPITTCNLRRNDHVSSVVGRDELDEFLRLPQRAVDPSLVRLHDRPRDELVRSADYQVAD
jgi:hypothetical protein